MLNTFNWSILLDPTPFGEQIYLNWLIDGVLLTVSLSITAWLIAFTLGSIIGIARTLPYKFLQYISRAYIELFRNIPLIVQFFIWYLAAPLLLPNALRQWFLSDLSPTIQLFITAALCLGCFSAARVAEQLRTGINSLPTAQQAAALALGLSLAQSYRYVILPNAYRVILPPLTSEMTNLVKNSAVASTIGLIELMAQANRLVDYTAYTIESYFSVTLCYLAINGSILFIMQRVEKYFRPKETRGLNHG